MLQKSKDKEYSNFWQASSQEQTKLSLWAFATKYRGDYCFFLFQFQFKQTNISHLGLRRCEAKNWGFLEHIQCLGSIDTIEHALALCWSWVSSSLHSASWRSSHPPPDARAHALHLVHLRLRGVTEHISAKPVVTWCDLWDFFFWRIRLTDPTPAARTPAVTAVAPAPTKRVAMANALNGIANAAPPLPRRNHATPAATCAALAPAHHGHLSASSPPPPSSISAAARVFGGGGGRGAPRSQSEWNNNLNNHETSPTCGTHVEEEDQARPLTCGWARRDSHHRRTTKPRREIAAFHGKVTEELRAASSPRVPTATVQLVLGECWFDLGWFRDVWIGDVMDLMGGFGGRGGFD